MRGGLAHHHDVSKALFEVYGTPGFAPRAPGRGRQAARGAGRVSQPLAGLTVLDFSTLLPGPLASLILAEAGAAVIKIERPGQRRRDARL